MNNQNQLAEMSELARKYVVANYTGDSIKQRLIEEIEKCA
jgi:hypothetical protein